MVSFVFSKEENELDQRVLTLMSEVDGRLNSTESMLYGNRIEYGGRQVNRIKARQFKKQGLNMHANFDH
jgi:hypothetical protein